MTLGEVDISAASDCYSRIASPLLALLAQDSRGDCQTRSTVDFRFPQLLHGRFGAHWGVVHLFEVVGLRLRRNDRKDLDVPVVVVVDRLPVSQVLRGMKTAGRGVQYQMEVLGDRAHPLQCSPQ